MNIPPKEDIKNQIERTGTPISRREIPKTRIINNNEEKQKFEKYLDDLKARGVNITDWN